MLLLAVARSVELWAGTISVYNEVIRRSLVLVRHVQQRRSNSAFSISIKVHTGATESKRDAALETGLFLISEECLNWLIYFVKWTTV